MTCLSFEQNGKSPELFSSSFFFSSNNIAGKWTWVGVFFFIFPFREIFCRIFFFFLRRRDFVGLRRRPFTWSAVDLRERERERESASIRAPRSVGFFICFFFSWSIATRLRCNDLFDGHGAPAQWTPPLSFRCGDLNARPALHPLKISFVCFPFVFGAPLAALVRSLK